MPAPHFILFSRLAFYPPHWEALRQIKKNYPQHRYTIITGTPPDLPAVHRGHGWVDAETARREGITVITMPRYKPLALLWLMHKIRQLRPDYLWVQEEPVSPYLLGMLAALWHTQTRIVTAVVENIFRPRPWPLQPIQQILWRRLNGLLGIAAASLTGVRAIGMPSTIPAYHPVAGCIAPTPTNRLPRPAPLTNDDFMLIFVGRLCYEKGWDLLLDSLPQLPTAIKLAIVGSGTDEPKLRQRLQDSTLASRVVFCGLQPHDEVLQLIQSADCLVLPSRGITTWREQFGAVLAEAMALGVPVIGSDSGGIPEVIGDAGLVFAENNSADLTAKILSLYHNPSLCHQYAAHGIRRYAEAFSIPAYATKIATSLGMS